MRCWPVALVVAASRTARGPGWDSAVYGGRARGQKKADKLPPLTIDADAPLLLDEGKQQAKDDKPVAPSVAENAACFVCHDNFQEEELVTQHAVGDTGCVDCHGKSYAHRNDENNTTPPDVMFPRDKIEASCLKCHDTHDAPAVKVIVRLRERMPRLASSAQEADLYRLPRAPSPGASDRGVESCHPRAADRQDRTRPWARPGPRSRRSRRWRAPGCMRMNSGQPTDQVVSTYRVTAAGSAVMEVLFPGTDHEMVTVYHQDGDDLILTHYCAAGNQPRMKCRRVGSESTV